MSKKNKADTNGFVYSTNPDFQFEAEQDEAVATIAPEAQQLKIKLDTKQRAGKVATLVQGFVGTDSDLEQLGKQVKNHCGSGGSVKDGYILVQGDQRDKVLQFLLKQGYTKSKKC